MPAISWTTLTPTSASTASSGDDELRSMMSNFAGGVGAMVFFPGSAESQGASAESSGEVRLGTARPSRGAPTGSHPEGFLHFSSVSSSLWHVGPERRGPLARPGMLSHVSAPNAAAVRLRQTGSFTTTVQQGSVVIQLPKAYRDDNYVVFASGSMLFDAWSIVGAQIQDSTAFVAMFSTTTDVAIEHRVHWQAEGWL